MERLAASLTLSRHHRYKIGPTLLLCHAPPLGTMLLHSLLEQQVNYDEDITPSDPPNNMQGPMTHARMCQLNLEVSSFLSDHFHTFKNRLLPNDVIFFRNIG